ncbi:hypothetical protein PoB_003759500 [Plakobranchus ocellatus]|uniref:Uncharacterized protein n=1 Tax=Plakobranchus ocellatus TaxID=259542 RepID=A0AAV4AUW8_9GAST|nr:hypothetical protein PoB_003759500 [Plakobranchus ocellatus]
MSMTVLITVLTPPPFSPAAIALQAKVYQNTWIGFRSSLPSAQLPFIPPKGSQLDGGMRSSPSVTHSHTVARTGLDICRAGYTHGERGEGRRAHGRQAAIRK